MIGDTARHFIERMQRTHPHWTPAQVVQKFRDDVALVYERRQTFADIALKWGFVNKHGRPVAKLAWEKAHLLFDFAVTYKLTTLEVLEEKMDMGMDYLKDSKAGYEELRQHRANVYRLVPR